MDSRAGVGLNGSPGGHARLPIIEQILVGIPAGLLDKDPGLGNAMHIFVGSKPPWCKIHDDAPQRVEWPPDDGLESRFQDLTAHKAEL